ncbi:MAG: MFS transporter [Desulfobacterales bacterium]|nr:MFS transporter [Desulfobacterales bacterium]
MKRNWKLFKILAIAIFSSALGQGLVVPLLPVYAHGMGASSLEIGMIFAAFPLSMTFALPVFGRLSDVKGRKPFITWGLFCYFITSIAFTCSSDVNALILIRFLQGVAAAMIMPVARAYAGEITPGGKEGLAMGLVNASSHGGLSAGPLLGGIMKDVYGIQTSFLSMGLVCVAGFLICAIFLPPTAKERTTPGRLPLDLKKRLKNKHLIGLLLFGFSSTMCVGAAWTFGPMIADVEFKMSGVAIGLYLTVSIVFMALLTPPMGVLADRFGKRPFIAVGGVVTAGAMIMFTQMREVWHLYEVSILFAAGSGISGPAIMGMAVVIGRKEGSMGAVISLLTMSETIGMVVGPILAGAVIDHVNLAAAFLGGAAFMLLAAALVLFLTSGFRDVF